MLKIDKDLLRQRVDAVEQDLLAEGLDALLVYANGSVLGNQGHAHPYLRYLCDFDGRNAPALLILRPGRAPILVAGTRFFMRPRTAETSLWFDDVRHAAPAQIGKQVAALLHEDRLMGKRVAYIGYNETPAPVWQALEQGMPGVTWVHDFASRIDRHRVRKDAVELAFHRKAADICDVMFDTLARGVHSGKPGYQLKSAMEHAALDAGCDYCDTWLTTAPAADYFRYHAEECQRVPQPGDQLLAGVMLTYDGHWGHAVRTGSVVAATPAQQRLYGICRDMYDAALDKLQPGKDLRDVNHAMNEVLRRHYPDDAVRRTRAGHGLGYAYEDPVASLAFPNAWEPQETAAAVETLPGMLLELHPHFFVPDVGGAMIGDMVLVTESGHELLTRHPRELLIW